MQIGKVVIAGPSAAGKTSIINRIAVGQFSSDIMTTVQAAFIRHVYKYKD